VLSAHPFVYAVPAADGEKRGKEKANGISGGGAWSMVNGQLLMINDYPEHPNRGRVVNDQLLMINDYPGTGIGGRGQKCRVHAGGGRKMKNEK